jgi:hypothetical protein
MAKKILFQGVPQQVLSEQVGAVYPESLSKQDSGQLVIGAQVVVPYSPGTGGFVMPVLYNTLSLKEESQRTPTFFKFLGVTSASGSTALWTPTAGKRFRLMGGTIIVPSTSTSAANVVSSLLDSATGFMNVAAIGTTTGGIAYNLSLPANGYLSSAVGNVLNLNNSAAYTAGGITISVWGTEE